MQEFRQLFDIAFRNDSGSEKEATFKFAKPDSLKNNLNAKKLRCQKFTLNNTSIPLFIPERVVSTSFFNVSANATVTNNVIGNTLTADSLKYFFIVRDNANTVSTLQYIQHIPENPALTAPPGPILDDFAYYQNEYYYYHRMEHFFSILESEIDNAISTLPGGFLSNCNITINSDSSFSFYIGKDAANNYKIEFSSDFLRLFPLKASLSPLTTGQSSYILDFSDFEASSGSNTFKVTSCLIYDSIFPFSEMLISSDDLGLNYTQFLTDESLSNNIQSAIYQSTILTYNLRTTQFTQIYDFYEYVNNDDSLWKNFYENSNPNRHVTIKISLRLKNNVIIPMKLKNKDLFTMSLELKCLL